MNNQFLVLDAFDAVERKKSPEEVVSLKSQVEVAQEKADGRHFSFFDLRYIIRGGSGYGLVYVTCAEFVSTFLVLGVPLFVAVYWSSYFAATNALLAAVAGAVAPSAAPLFAGPAASGVANPLVAFAVALTVALSTKLTMTFFHGVTCNMFFLFETFLYDCLLCYTKARAREGAQAPPGGHWALFTWIFWKFALCLVAVFCATFFASNCLYWLLGASAMSDFSSASAAFFQGYSDRSMSNTHIWTLLLLDMFCTMGQTLVFSGFYRLTPNSRDGRPLWSTREAATTDQLCLLLFLNVLVLYSFTGSTGNFLFAYAISYWSAGTSYSAFYFFTAEVTGWMAGMLLTISKNSAKILKDEQIAACA